MVDYSATKGAIVSFTKALAGQLAPKGIRVNAVAPGPVSTRSLDWADGITSQDIYGYRFTLPYNPPLERLTRWMTGPSLVFPFEDEPVSPARS
jgi:NAD(P)-dependent dehydrogenase (short-subunit alcohol dehydrogenase family)